MGCRCSPAAPSASGSTAPGAWGAGDIAGIVAFNSLTLVGRRRRDAGAWAGSPHPTEIGGLFGSRAAAVTGLASVGLWRPAGRLRPGLGLVFRRPLTLARLELRLAAPRVAAAQLVLAVVDWSLAALTLWLLLPPSASASSPSPASYTAASIAGVISHVPAGLGVFEAVLLLALPEGAHAPGVAAALIALPADLLPAAAAGGGRWCSRLHQARRRQRAARRAARPRAPRHASWCCRICWPRWSSSAASSCSSPAPRRPCPSRLDWLAPLAPLALIELSHFLGSLAGLALLVLALGLRRRLEAAWWATVARARGRHRVLAAQGLDWEEALYLAHRARGACCRRAGPSTARAGCWRSASRPLG